MLSIERSLADRLQQQNVHIDVRDTDTVWFRNVPANSRFFNKASTNLLVKRPDAQLPFAVCVDEDLLYEGVDPDVSRAFAKGRHERGWRVLFVGAVGDDLQPVVERALDALGFDGAPPRVQPSTSGVPRAPRVIDSAGVDLSALVRAGEAEPCLGRVPEVDALCLALLRQRPVVPVIVGPSGVGKTNLLHGVAARLLDRHPDLRVMRVDLGAWFAGTLFGAERESLASALFNELANDAAIVVALEHLELIRADAPHGALLLGHAVDRGARLVATSSPDQVGRLQIDPLRRRLQPMPLSELPLSAMPAVLQAHAAAIARRSRVAVSAAMIDAVIDGACAIDGVLPAKAIALLDGAVSAAALDGRSIVTIEDLHSGMNAGDFRAI